MLESERFRHQKTPPRRRVPPKQHHPLVVVAAAMMLTFGAIFGRIAGFCTNAAQRCTDPATVRTWMDAVAYIQGFKPGASQPRTQWEKRLLRVGPSVLMGIGGTLIVFWLLLLVGGTLAWLVTQGFGFALLLAAVLTGTIIGAYLARLGRFGVEREQLN